MPTLEIFSPATVHSLPTYSHIGVVNGPARLIYFAGQIGRDIKGNVPQKYADQVRLAYQNLGTCLKAAGATSKDIVKLTYYIVNYAATNRAHANVMGEFLGNHAPPTTLVPVEALAAPGVLFEVEATAAVSERPLNREKSYLPNETTVDVVVVGAGLSGLQAAVDIQRSGLSVIVLEARDRVGGKVWSKQASKGVVELGAAWINDTNQSKSYALAKKLGLEFIEQPSDGKCVIQQGENLVSSFAYGDLPKVSAEDQKNLVRIRNLIEATCHSIDIRHPVGFDDITLEEFVLKQNPGEVALSTMKIWTRAMLGVEPSQMSALYFLDYCKSGGGLQQMRSDRKDGGQYLRIKTGTSSLPNGLVSMLNPGSVVLKSPVTRISQSSSGSAIVYTSNENRYHCKRVVVSLPTPLYKDIVFTPSLPAAKLELSQVNTLGFYVKLILIYSKPWWRSSGFCGLSQSFVGPASVTRDSSNDSVGQYSLTCFIVGKPGREWSNLPKEERIQSAISQVATMFGSEHALEAMDPVEVFEQDWSREEFSKGCPCPVMPPNTLSRLSTELRKPFGVVHFVGTETAYEWKGYMDGALRSGERGASEVIQALTSLNSLKPKL